MDIGGHRFFSKDDTIMQYWLNLMPIQKNPQDDDDQVMLVRQRISRIFYLRKFFDYPISLKWETFKNMGLRRTTLAALGYLFALIVKRKEKSLEDFYVNRFGKPLYKMFFEDYTEKVWGVHPSRLGADWGSQRVKGLSLSGVLKNVVGKYVSKSVAYLCLRNVNGGVKSTISNQAQNEGIKQKNVETSLIEEFIYPKFGPGQLWNIVKNNVLQSGGDVLLNSEIVQVNVHNQQVHSVVVQNTITRANYVLHCDYFLSSMPIKELVEKIKGVDVPDNVKLIAQSLQYRDFITVGLLVDKLEIENKTKEKTFKNRTPDTWIYIQDNDVYIGRLQIFNNWSPYMVNDFQNMMWIGLEYFCNEGDHLWNMDDNDFVKLAISELEKLHILDPNNVHDATVIKVKKAYPAYIGAYYQLDIVKKILDNIDNLFCIGRNGQHRYNNMDHSMMTAIVAVDNIKNNITTKDNVWNVNTENDYLETRK
jgi:protoporphyrinogen oxidase